MPASGRRILVVDDDPWIAKMLEFVASDAGHAAVVAKDGQDALDKFAEVMPDLVLLDLGLPKKNGREVLAEIKADDDLRTIPVVVMTASDSQDDMLECERLGVDCYITKPVDLSKFISLVKQLKNSWSADLILPVT